VSALGCFFSWIVALTLALSRGGEGTEWGIFKRYADLNVFL